MSRPCATASRMVPIRPFVAEFTAKYAGYTCQEVAHDYKKAFAAARKCAADFDWDAVVSNMVYVWTGLTQAIGLRYYGIPGIDIPADIGFQYREPPRTMPSCGPRSTTQLIDDPTASSTMSGCRACPPRCGDRRAGHLRAQPLVRQGRHGDAELFQRLRPPERSPARGVRHGLGDLRDLQGADGHHRRQAARLPRAWWTTCTTHATRCWRPARRSCPTCTTSPSSRPIPISLVPIGYWMHRGGVPFISPEIFSNVYWPTVKPIIEELWDDGIRRFSTPKASGTSHLEAFRRTARPEHRLPRGPGRHFQGPPHAGRQVLPQRRHSQCAAGLRQARGSPGPLQEGDRGRGPDGGYIMDAGAIMQNEHKSRTSAP